MLKKLITLTMVFLAIGLMNICVFAEEYSVEARFIQEDGEWIYYLDDKDFGNLYKIKKDGSYQSKVFDTRASEFLIVDDWIYYIKTDGIYFGEGELYRVRKNGLDSQFLFKHDWSPVKDLEYSNGYITFYAGNMNKMSVHDLQVINLGDWPYNPADNKNGHLFAHGKDYSAKAYKVYVYDLVTDESDEIVFDNYVNHFTYDDESMYYLSSVDHHIQLIKASHSGENKQVLVDDVSSMNPLQLIGGYVYYVNYIESNDKRIGGKWRVSVDGGEPELFIDKTIPSYLLFENVIDDNVYLENGDFIATYNFSNGKFQYTLYEPFMFHGRIDFSESNYIYLEKNGLIQELNPSLSVNRSLSDFKSLDGKEYTIAKDSYVSYANRHLLVSARDKESLIINIDDMTVYGFDKNIFVAGINDTHVYLYGDKNSDDTLQLYRLPLGDYSLANKTFVANVSSARIEGNTILDVHNGIDYYIKVIDANTLSSKTLTTMVHRYVHVKGDYVYFNNPSNGGLYRVSINGGKVKRVYSGHDVLDFLVTSDAIYANIWSDQGATYIGRMDLYGRNLVPICAEGRAFFYGEMDGYFLMGGAERWVSYSPVKDSVEMISDLYRHFDRKKAVSEENGSPVTKEVIVDNKNPDIEIVEGVAINLKDDVYKNGDLKDEIVSQLWEKCVNGLEFTKDEKGIIHVKGYVPKAPTGYKTLLSVYAHFNEPIRVLGLDKYYFKAKTNIGANPPHQYNLVEGEFFDYSMLLKEGENDHFYITFMVQKDDYYDASVSYRLDYQESNLIRRVHLDLTTLDYDFPSTFKWLK